MWRMCRLLDVHRHEWVPQIAQAKAYDKNKETLDRFAGTEHFDKALNQETYLEMIHGEDAFGDLKVYPSGLIMTYIRNYMWNGKNRIVNISTDKNHQAELGEANKVLRLCMNHVPPFIEKEKEGDRIFLTYRGEVFIADWFGLFKQYLEELGTVRVALGTFIIALLPYLVPLFMNWLHSL